MPKEPDDTAVRAWARLNKAQRLSFTSIERALKDAGMPPLAWYDVLLELDRAGNKGLRPFQLERELLLPQYGISRLVERIEKSGHLKREDCKGDGRGQFLSITRTGRQLRLRMWPVYAQAIEDAVGSKLTSAQAKTLSGLLARLLE